MGTSLSGHSVPSSFLLNGTPTIGSSGISTSLPNINFFGVNCVELCSVERYVMIRNGGCPNPFGLRKQKLSACSLTGGEREKFEFCVYQVLHTYFEIVEVQNLVLDL